MVVANVQTAGRGRHGRTWISQENNLYFSLLLKPDVNLQHVGQLGIVIGCALGIALHQVVDSPDEIVLKWPNDVFRGGKKCAGILIETDLNERNELESVLVGMGVNTKNAPEIGAALGVDNEFVLEHILNEINATYNVWCAGDFEKILKSWHELAFPQGAEMSVKLGDDIIEGVFEHVDLQGHLHLRLADNTLRKITAGDIYVTGH